MDTDQTNAPKFPKQISTRQTQVGIGYHWTQEIAPDALNDTPIVLVFVQFCLHMISRQRCSSTKKIHKKITDRYRTECCHVLSYSFAFPATILVKKWPVLPKERLKIVITSLDRQGRVTQACQNIPIQCHCLSQPSFLHVFAPFLSNFGLVIIVQMFVKTHLKVC